jgi:phosphatidylserine/phosphatidylglycerophosphate/cardiolipin synthase-like enzyme
MRRTRPRAPRAGAGVRRRTKEYAGVVKDTRPISEWLHLTGASPWRPGNHCRLLNDGPEFFRQMLAAVEAAQSYVLLEMYLVESGFVATRFIDTLVAAAARGVTVLALFDGFGALGLHAEDRARLVEGGVQLSFFNVLGWRKRLANLLRDHRKLLLVDGEVAYVGGAGLTDEFASVERGGEGWRDVMIEVRGPVVADWQALFDATWRTACGRPAPGPRRTAEPRPDGVRGRVTTSAGWHRAAIATSIVQRIDTAAERAWIMSAYFVPSRRLRKALRRAARRGVDVRLLVPGPLTDHPLVRYAARRFYGKMLWNRVRIFEFQPRVLHAKMVVCDDWVSVGSSNLDRWSFKWNLEANQEIEDPVFADLAANVFERDCAQSVELNREAWRHRGRIERLRERFAGMLDRALERWPRPRLPW